MSVSVFFIHYITKRWYGKISLEEVKVKRARERIISVPRSEELDLKNYKYMMFNKLRKGRYYHIV